GGVVEKYRLLLGVPCAVERKHISHHGLPNWIKRVRTEESILGCASVSQERPGPFIVIFFIFPLKLHARRALCARFAGWGGGLEWPLTYVCQRRAGIPVLVGYRDIIVGVRNARWRGEGEQSAEEGEKSDGFVFPWVQVWATYTHTCTRFCMRLYTLVTDLRACLHALV
ncbi:unnamed protein product, partial [Laminaria digitata]